MLVHTITNVIWVPSGLGFDLLLLSKPECIKGIKIKYPGISNNLRQHWSNTLKDSPLQFLNSFENAPIRIALIEVETVLSYNPLQIPFYTVRELQCLLVNIICKKSWKLYSSCLKCN